MRKRIEDLISVISNGNYDAENVHQDYDKLLEDFIIFQSYSDDPELFPLMKTLIELDKDFWYA